MDSRDRETGNGGADLEIIRNTFGVIFSFASHRRSGILADGR